MTHSNLSYRCYILPAVAAIAYFILSIPSVISVFNDWIPDYYYCVFIKALLLLVILFLTCRILDILWIDVCHDENCTNSLTTVCMSLIDNTKDNPIDTPDISSENITTE